MKKGRLKEDGSSDPLVNDDTDYWKHSYINDMRSISEERLKLRSGKRDDSFASFSSETEETGDSCAVCGDK
jgi:hypothetical protein